jgi:Transposase DDE domain
LPGPHLTEFRDAGTTPVGALDAEALDKIIGAWLRALAQAGKLDVLLTAIAIDGKWLRGIADGSQKLFAAMLHEEKVIIGQHRTPEDTNEITQVRDLLDAIGLTGCVVTADAAHAQRDTAEYIAGTNEDGGREADYAVTVKGDQPGLQRTGARSPITSRHPQCPRAYHPGAMGH